MDLLKTVREIGFFETSRNLMPVMHSEELQEKVGAVMPLPTQNPDENIDKVAAWLQTFHKDHYMFLNPEIALIERLAKYIPEKSALITAPCDMEEEVRERLHTNLPKSMDTALLQEPFFPKDFFPGNGIWIACGYMAGERLMVLPETYRMIEHYSGFLGKKVFVPYVILDSPMRYKGWLQTDPSHFNKIWKGGENDE